MRLPRSATSRYCRTSRYIINMTLEFLSIGHTHPIVSDINQTLMSGTFICLTGRNGTGKSTLLKTLAGLIPPLSGQIRIGDTDIQTLTPRALAQQIGLVLTQTPDLPNTTLRELVAYGRLPYASWLGKLNENDYAVADLAIEQLGISPLAHRKIDQLSDGERQKAMIARALAQGTQYLLLDEPSAFLDHESRLELMSLLVRLAHHDHKAILLSTHDLELANLYADCLWQIKEGKLSCI